MDKNNNKLWIAGAGVVAACPSLFCCAMGVGTLAGTGTYDLGAETGSLPPVWGAVMICFGLLPWLLPAGVWAYVSRRPDAAPAPQPATAPTSYPPQPPAPAQGIDTSEPDIDLSDWDND